MKFGIRTPSPKRSIKARTTGKAKRTLKSSVNPLYRKKGMGVVNNPKKAVYNKVYNKTTASAVPKLNLNDSNSTTQINMEQKYSKYIRHDEDKVHVNMELLGRDIENYRRASIGGFALSTICILSISASLWFLLFALLGYMLTFAIIIKRNFLKILYNSLLDVSVPPESGGQFTEPIPRRKEERDFDIYFKLYEEARKLEKDGNADKALEIYTNILEEFEPTGTAYYERPCIILEKQKRYDEAIQICSRAIEAINNKRFNATADEFEHRLNRLLRKKEKQKKL